MLCSLFFLSGLSEMGRIAKFSKPFHWKFPLNIPGFSKEWAETCRAAGMEGRQQTQLHSVHNSTKCQAMLVESFAVLVLLADTVSAFSALHHYQPVLGPFKTAEIKELFLHIYAILLGALPVGPSKSLLNFNRLSWCSSC